MVAIVTGNGLGLERSSAKLPGSWGQLGSAFLGRSGDGVYVNAATGNLIVQNVDEVLIGTGPDALFNRTYNSLGNYTNLDATLDSDEWLHGTQRKMMLSGTANQAGSSIALTDWDGTQVVFTYTAGAYKATEKPDRDDSVTISGSTITWTEGQSRLVQIFNNSIGGRIVSAADADGNTITYTYDAATTAGKLTRVTTANSTGSQYNYTDLSYTSGRLTSLATSYYDVPSSTNKTLTRTTYGYDAAGRLSTVTTDLTPDNTGDSSVYTTTYGYKDATSKLVTSITQTDGTNLAITYDGSNRVQYLDLTAASGSVRRTTFAYDTTNRVTTITDPLSNVYKMTFDASNQLTKLEEPAPVSGGNASFRTYEYNANGDVTRVLTFDNAANVGTPSLAIAYEVRNYDASGNLIERVDGANRGVAYTYGSLNEVLTETHYTGFDADGLANGAAPSGAMTIHYVYDASGNGVADDGSGSGDDAAEKHLRFRISAEGRVTEYRYNALGQLIAQIDYFGTLYSGGTWTEADLASWASGTADKSLTQRTDYTYDFRGNMTTATSFAVTDSTGAGVTSGEWSRLTYVYDQFGKLRSKLISGNNTLGGEATPVAETFLYDGLGRMISATDLYGQTTTISINDGTRTTTISTPGDATQTQVFNIAGELLSQAVSGSGIPTGTATYAYDALGRLRMATDPLGVNTYYVYDKQSRMTAKIDGDGSMTEFKYDGADRLIAQVTYGTAVSAGNLTTLGAVATNTEVATIRPAAATADRWTWTVYDRSGAVAGTIDAGGAVTKLTYDGAGRLIGTTRYANLLAATTVNGSDGISGYRSTLPTSLTLPTVDAANDRTARAFFDNDGLLIGSLDADGYLTEIVYDKAGRKTETIRYSGATSSAYWASGTFAQLKGSLTLSSANDIHNYWLYDGRGRVGATIDGEGNVTRLHYTARGDVDQQVVGQKVTASTSYTLASLPSATGTLETTRYYRNAAGQVTSQERTLASGTETTAYTYDTRGRLLTQTVSETISSESRTNTFRYDVKGRLIGELSGVGSAALAALGGSPTPTQVDTIYATYGTTYQYDLADRLIQRVTPDGTGTSGVKTLYYYDGDGQLRYQVNALGEVTEYRYAVGEDRTDVIVYGTRIAGGTLATLTGGLVTASITNAVAAIANASLDSRTQAAYNTLGQLTNSYNPSYVGTPTADNYTVQTYDAFGALLTDKLPTGVSGTPWDTTSYAYNRRGLLISANENVSGSTLGSQQTAYSYDGFGRKIGEAPNVTDARSRSFGYDRVGRLVSQSDYLGLTTGLTYDARSNVLSSIDRAGKTTTFSYDQFNRNVTTTTPEGISSSVRRNAYGQTILITDGAGRTKTYTYDKNGNLKTVTDAAGTTTYNYDNADRLIDVIDAKGVDTHYTYDAVGRVLTLVHDYGSGKLNLTTTYAYDAKGQQTTVTDAAGVVTTYTYDLKGQKTRVVQDSGSGKLNLTTDFVYRADGTLLSQTDGVGTAAQRTTAFVYDTRGRLTSRTEDSGSGKLNLTTSYAYDANDNLVAQTDPLGRVTRFIYDKDDRLVLSIDAEGGVTQNGYDEEGRVVWSRIFSGALTTGQRAALADPAQDNQWNTVVADGSGNLTFTKWVRNVSTGVVTSATATTLAAGSNDLVSRTLYDGDGRAAYHVDAEGYVTKNAYDGAGNVIKTWHYAAVYAVTNGTTKAALDALVPAGDPSDAVITTYAYDSANRLTDTTDGEGFVTHYVLDVLGQITDVHVAYGTADAAVTHRVFDNVGRVTSETRGYGQSEAATTSFGYDALGRATSITNPRGYVTTRTFDNLGRMLTETVPLNASQNATTSFGYDALGRATSVTDARGYATTRTFDGLGRIVSQTVPLDASHSATTSWQYDGAGNQVKVTDPRGNAGYFYYDGLNRLVRQADAEGFVTETTYGVGGEVATVKRYYNQASNLGSLSVTVQPTVTAHAKDATTSFTYDKVGNLKTTTDAEGATESYSYDAFGNRTAMTNKLGGTTAYGYNRRGLLTLETKAMPAYDYAGTQILTEVQTTYAYDGRGNLKTRVEGANVPTGTQMSYAKLTTTFTYDRLDRLLTQTDPAFMGQTPVTAWQYDANGNVILQTAADGGKTYSFYDYADRRIAQISPVGTLTKWEFDASGNLVDQKVYATAVSLPGSAGGTPPAGSGACRETQFVYDRNNRVIQSTTVNVRTGAYNGSAYVTAAGQNLTSYNEYDAAGNLIKETDANGAAVYHWYDKNGHETAKLDQERALTAWTRDSNGNVLSETRFAATFGGTPDPYGAAPSVSSGSSDRTTAFTYDRMGRRLTETRAGVVGYLVSGTGVLSVDSRAATVAYTYNALGEVTSKAESTGDLTDYVYDNQGRLVRQLDAVSADFNSSGAATTRHVTYFYYDANNNLVRTVEKAEPGSMTPGGATSYASGYSSADDHVTRLNYDGRLLQWTIDANGGQRYSKYDVMGRRTHDYYQRANSAGTVDTVNAVYDGNLVSYDLAGRVTAQWQANQNSSGSWVAGGPVTQFTYNAFGEVTAKAIGGYTQESFEYDNAGRVVKTTGGDGVMKFVVYDANGNATLLLQSNGRDMSSDTVDSALSYVGAVTTMTATDVVATITVYDKRNMAVATREPNRQIANASNLATTVTQTLVRSQTYNAFGEIASETDARGNTTSYSYNTMGRTLQKQSPWVDVTSETGVTTSARPTENYAYDISGRQVGTQNANGFWTTSTLLGGTGYSGSDAKVLKVFTPDSSVAEVRYDAFGNVRVQVDGLGRPTFNTYDKVGNLLVVSRPGGLSDYYAYDILGQRVKHWNNVDTTPIYGEPYYVSTGYMDPKAGWVETGYWVTPVVGSTISYETTDYDTAGRVTSQVNMAGDVSTYTYSWGSDANSGLGLTGAWTKAGSYATGKTSSETTDAFGRMLARTDLGGHTYAYSYNRAGQLVGQTNSAGQNIVYTYYTTGKLATMFDNSTPPGTYSSASVDGTYTYDAEGNRTYEKLVGTSYWYDSYYGYGGSTTTTFQEGQGTYDALNRLLTFTDAGASGNGSVSVSNLYDAAGNVRRTTATHYTIGSNQALSSAPVTEDYWYLYDALNRMTLVKGDLVGGIIQRVGADARTITYDAAGQRASEARTISIPPYYDSKTGYSDPGYTYESRENFAYNADGLLTQVNIATGGYGAYGTQPSTAGTGGTLRSQTSYDLTGRVTGVTEYAGDGTTVNYSRYAIAYDARGNVKNESTSTRNGGTVNYATTTNTYGAGGVLTSQSTSGTPSSSYSFTYQWWDSAQQSVITNTGTGHTSTFQYNPNGHVTSVYINDGRPRAVTYVTDAAGQILQRREADNTSNGDPKQVWWFFDGKQVGTTGNNGNADPDYETAMNERLYSSSTGPFRFGSNYGATFSDFDMNFNALSPGEGGGAGAVYTVRQGDTLDKLARTFFGDASLWYMIADANGLTGASQLVAGQTIRIPAKLANVHNNADTFRPYDAAKSIGDVMPSTPNPPPPPKKKGCGVFGAILGIIIGAIVAAVLPGIGQAIGKAITGVLGGGAAATAVGTTIGVGIQAGFVNMVTQGISVALGIQDKFSWKGVAMASIGAVVGEIIPDINLFKKPVKIGKIDIGKVANKMVTGALESVVTQGIGVALGLQDEFSWSGVAADAVSNAIKVPSPKGANGKIQLPKLGEAILVGAAKIAANAAARSVIDGTDFGDNVIAAMPSVVGQILGDLATGAIQDAQRKSALKKAIFQAQDSRYSVAVRKKIADDAVEGRNGSSVNVESMVPFGKMKDGKISLNDMLVEMGAANPEVGGMLAYAYLEEIGHWAAGKAQELSGMDRSDPMGEEGARFANAVVAKLSKSNSGNIGFNIPLEGGGRLQFEANTTLLRASALASIESGRIFSDAVGPSGEQMWGPDAHFGVTFLSAMGVGTAMGLDPQRAGSFARVLGVSSQIADMFRSYDAVSNFVDKYSEFARAGSSAAMTGLAVNPEWTVADERHMRLIYDGLHGLPATKQDATAQWSDAQRKKTADYIVAKFAEHDLFRAGIALHRFGDLYAHVDSNGKPFWGDVGHGLTKNRGHDPDLIFLDGEHYNGGKVTSYQFELSRVLARGYLAAGYATRGKTIEDGTAGGIMYFHKYYDAAKTESSFIQKIIGDHPGLGIPSLSVIQSTAPGAPQGLNTTILNVARDLKSK